MHKPPQDNVWDQRYDQENYVYGVEPNDFLRSLSSRLPQQAQVLCLGEGEGRNAVFLAQQGHHVVAVDSSRVGLKKAQRLADQRQVRIVCQPFDLTDYRIEQASWDVIVSIFVHVPPALRRDLHRRVVDGLRPGGLFILESYTPKQLEYKTGGPPTPELMMRLSELEDELSGLNFLQAQETERLVLEGDLHHGRGAVVQLLAQKQVRVAGSASA